MVDLRTEHDTAAVIKYLDEEYDAWQLDTFKHIVWAMHRLVSDDEFEVPELTENEVRRVLAQTASREHHELSEEHVDRAEELRELGISVSDIATILNHEYDYHGTVREDTVEAYLGD